MASCNRACVCGGRCPTPGARPCGCSACGATPRMGWGNVGGVGVAFFLGGERASERVSERACCDVTRCAPGQQPRGAGGREEFHLQVESPGRGIRARRVQDCCAHCARAARVRAPLRSFVLNGPPASRAACAPGLPAGLPPDGELRGAICGSHRAFGDGLLDSKGAAHAARVASRVRRAGHAG